MKIINNYIKKDTHTHTLSIKPSISIRTLYLITENDTKILQPKNKTYPHKYKVFSFVEDCLRIGAYNSHHQDEAQQKHVLMFNKLSKPSTFSYKFSLQIWTMRLHPKTLFKTLHPTLKPFKSLHLASNPTIYPTKNTCVVPQKPHPKTKKNTLNLNLKKTLSSLPWVPLIIFLFQTLGMAHAEPEALFFPMILTQQVSQGKTPHPCALHCTQSNGVERVLQFVLQH